MGNHTLLLNASFEPLNVLSWQRAILLLVQGKVEVVEESEVVIRTVSLSIRIPAVMRLTQYIPLGRRRQIIRFSRANVFLRDQYTCQYCLKIFPKQSLTLDHVVPVAQGGKKEWGNIVSSCRKCNQVKGGRTPKQAGMALKRPPKEPRWLPKSVIAVGLSLTVMPDQWKPYLKV